MVFKKSFRFQIILFVLKMIAMKYFFVNIIHKAMGKNKS